MIDTSNPWKRLQTSTGFDSDYFAAKRDTVLHRSGRTHPYVSIDAKFCGVTIVPIDAEGYTTLVGQYRYVLGRFTWEVVRGGVPLNSSPLDGAKLELLEETGFSADHWMHLFDLNASPGLSNEIAPCFVAWGLHQGKPQHAAEESLSQRRVSFGDAITMALTGEVADAASVSTILAIQTRALRRDLPDELLGLLTLSR